MVRGLPVAEHWTQNSPRPLAVVTPGVRGSSIRPCGPRQRPVKLTHYSILVEEVGLARLATMSR